VVLNPILHMIRAARTPDKLSGISLVTKEPRQMETNLKLIKALNYFAKYIMIRLNN